MLTPRFELSQTDDKVEVRVHAPYANIKDTEVYVEGNDFRFYSTPYYLRLQLPGDIVEDDESSGSYDCDKGIFLLKFTKVNQGQHFENLDMITTLLAPPKEKKDFLKPKIEVISNPAADVQVEDDAESTKANDDDETDPGDDWFVPQTPATITSSLHTLLPNSPKYGFANKISGALASFDAVWIKEIIDLPMPDSVPMEDRKKLREAQELEAFDEDQYMVDLVSNDSTESHMNYVADWETLKSEEITLSDAEIDLLKELPNKEYLLDDDETKIVLYGLVDIIFGSCYNNRITSGENTSESSWDINKLSSTLCWFQHFSSMDETLKACVRRSLCYPLCRNWNLAMKVVEDVKKVVKLGKKYIIKRFCEIHELFNNSYEPRYLLNQLYIKDYLIWLQKVSSSVIDSINPMLDNVTLKKCEMGLDLDELEVATLSVYFDNLCFENAVDEIANDIEATTLEDVKKATDEFWQDFTSTTTSSSSSSSSSDSDSSDSETDSDSDSSSSSTVTTTSSTNNKTKLDSDDLTESGSE